MSVKHCRTNWNYFLVWSGAIFIVILRRNINPSIGKRYFDGTNVNWKYFELHGRICVLWAWHCFDGRWYCICIFRKRTSIHSGAVIFHGFNTQHQNLSSADILYHRYLISNISSFFVLNPTYGGWQSSNEFVNPCTKFKNFILSRVW